MDSKTQRYMQRIEQIMNTSKRGNANYRPSKSPISCKPNNLDKYLKYELSTKIIQKIINQSHHHFLHQFFNAVRVTEYRQKEKIYKFIAIQKATPMREISVDGTIVCKIMITALKELFRQRYTYFINCLQTFPNQAGTPQKPRIARLQSARLDSPVHNRMRTLTNISKMDRKSSGYPQEIESPSHHDDQSKNKNKESAIKCITKCLKTKIIMFVFLATQKIKTVGLLNQVQNQKITDKQVTNLQKSSLSIPQQSIFKKGGSCFYLQRFANNTILFSFKKIKTYHLYCIRKNQLAQGLAQALSKCFQRKKLQHFHFLFCIARSIAPSNIQCQTKAQQIIFASLKSRSSASNQGGRSHMTESSQVQPFNPLAKLNFYYFVDKIFKINLLLGKHLIVLKQAFVHIDQYASFAYKLEESLKVAPNSVLMTAFQSIRLAAAQFQQVKRQIDPKYTQKVNIFFESVHRLWINRVIEGFTHIAIMSKERDLKIVILPARQNIVEQTKKFIEDRDEYSAHSHTNWEQLKSIILSSSSSDKIRKKSSVLP